MLLFGDPTVSRLIGVAIALLIGMTFHEYMHNYVAWLMGDSTPVERGALTLNPLKHIYWPGWFMWVFLGFGILGRAYVNPSKMAYPRVAWARKLSIRQRSGLVSLAGPAGSLIVALVFGVLYRLCFWLYPDILFINSYNDVIPSLNDVFYYTVSMNILLGFFSLVPLGMLDGRDVFEMFIPPLYWEPYDRFQNQFGNMVLMGIIFLSFVDPALDVFWPVFGAPSFRLTAMVMGF